MVWSLTSGVISGRKLDSVGTLWTKSFRQQFLVLFFMIGKSKKELWFQGVIP